MGTANPNSIRDKRILELKAKHNFYVMPTFNANNLRIHTKKFKNEIDNDTLTLYSGGGYIAKSRLMSSYSRRGHTAGQGSKRSTNYRHRKLPRRFNEDLEAASQKSINKRRALSRGAIARQKDAGRTMYPQSRPAQEDDRQNVK